MASADFGEWKSANVVNEKPRYWGMKTGISSEDLPLGHCAIPAFVPSKTFSRNKTPYKVHLVLLKTFSQNQIAGPGGAYYLHIGLPHTISRRKSAAW